jgi:hypothetical protein
MQRSTKQRAGADTVGMHVADDALRLVRVRRTGADPPAVVACVALRLPAGVVRHGLVTALGPPPEVATRAAQFAGGAPVRIALTSFDAAAAPFGERGRGHDPAGLLASRAAPHGPPIDVVWADVVRLDGRIVALAGARRSSLLRVAGAAASCGLEVEAVEAGAVSLVSAAHLLAPAVRGPTVVRLHAPGVHLAASVGAGGRLDAAAGPPTPGPAAFTVRTVDGTVVDLAPRLARLLGRHDPATAAAYAPAVGAASCALPGAFDNPDLRRANVLRPLADEAVLPRWAVEALPDPAPPALAPARRTVRLARRKRA